MQKHSLSKPNPPASYKGRARADDVFDRFFTNSFITGALAVACVGGIWHAIHGPFESVVPRALYALSALLLLLKVVWTALLQFIVGNTEGYSHDPTHSAAGWSFRNWGKSQEFHPRDVANPASLDELLKTVTTFGRAGRKLKAIGALHSWSACAATDDVAILTGQLNRVINIDKAKLTVTVEAGIRLQDLYAHLDAAGLALPTLPNVDVIHLGGAVANATHGTNFAHGTMSSLIQAMQVVVFQPSAKDPSNLGAGAAELVTLSKADADPTRRRWLEGAVASFGSLGVTYSVTLQCVEAYVSWVSERAFDYEKEVKGHIAEIARSYNSAQMVMWPVTGIVQTKVQVPMSSRLVPTDATNFFSNKELMQAKLIFFALQPSAKTFLWLRRMLAGLLHLLLKQSPAIAVFQTRKRAAVMHWTDAELVSRLSAALSTTPWINLEYAIPVERADEAATRLKALLCQYTGISVFAMRPVGADEIGYLSPTQGRPTVFFDVPFNRDLEAQGVYAKVEELLLSLGGRCSWSRLFKAPPSEVVKQYPRFAEFQKVKKEMDPFNVFSNKFSDGILFQKA